MYVKITNKELIMKYGVHFFKDEKYYTTEEVTIPCDVPGFNHAEWLYSKFNHQYAGMTLVALSTDGVPILIKGSRR